MEVQRTLDVPETKQIPSFYWVSNYTPLIERNVAQYISTRKSQFPPGGKTIDISQPAYKSLENSTCRWLANMKEIPYPTGEAREKFEDVVGELLISILCRLMKK